MCKGRRQAGSQIYEYVLGLGIWVGDRNLGVVGHGNGYYPPVQGDRERRKAPRNRPGDSTMKRVEQGGRTYKEKKEREPGRRAPEGRVHPKP